MAQRRSHDLSLLSRALEERQAKLAMVALEVAVETGDPIGRVLATQVESLSSTDLLFDLGKRCDSLRIQFSLP